MTTVFVMVRIEKKNEKKNEKKKEKKRNAIFKTIYMRLVLLLLYDWPITWGHIPWQFPMYEFSYERMKKEKSFLLCHMSVYRQQHG